MWNVTQWSIYWPEPQSVKNTDQVWSQLCERQVAAWLLITSLTPFTLHCGNTVLLFTQENNFMPNKAFVIANIMYNLSSLLQVVLVVDNNYLFLPQHVPYLVPISGPTPGQLPRRFSLISHYQNVLNTLRRKKIDKPKSKSKVPKSDS